MVEMMETREREGDRRTRDIVLPSPIEHVENYVPTKLCAWLWIEVAFLPIEHRPRRSTYIAILKSRDTSTKCSTDGERRYNCVVEYSQWKQFLARFLLERNLIWSRDRKSLQLARSLTVARSRDICDGNTRASIKVRRVEDRVPFNRQAGRKIFTRI